MMRTEIELQTDRCNVPELIPLSFHKTISEIVKCEKELDNCLDDLGYIKYFLDQFESALLSGNSELILIDTEYCRLKKEADYILFLNELFNDNGSSAILFGLGIDFSDIDVCMNKVEKHDKIDQYIIMNIYKTYIESDMYWIDDKNLFDFFVKGFLRETLSGVLYFDKLDIFLSYGFDMVLPVYVKDSQILAKYSKLADRYDLYLRK